MTITESPLTITMPLRMTEGGLIRIGDSRVTLELFLTFYRKGETVEELAEHFDTLELADIHYVIGFYLQNKEAVERYLTEASVDEAAILERYKDVFNQVGLHEKLLARSVKSKS